MDGSELSEAFDRLGISPTYAARVLGIDDRRVRYMLDGRAPVPELVARVLRLMLEGALAPARLVKAASR